LGEGRHRTRQRQEASRQAPRRCQEGRPTRDGQGVGPARQLRRVVVAGGARTGAEAGRPSMSGRAWRSCLSCLALLITAVAGAQPTLMVNGREIFGNTTGIVSGSSYAPAAALAPALGAVLSLDAQRSLAVLDAGGRLLQIAVADSAAAATAASGAMKLDGVTLAGPAAVAFEGEVYLPVKQVSEALGATITYVEGQNTVLVVQPRARVS